MDKKYEMTNEVIEFEGRILHRVRALRDFGDVKKGDLGGFIGEERNLSQEENAWVYNNAKVCDDAIVKGNANVKDNAIVKEHAIVKENAVIRGYAIVKEPAIVKGNAVIRGYAQIFGTAIIKGDTRIYENVKVYDCALVDGYTIVRGNAEIFGRGQVKQSALIEGSGKVSQNQLALYGITKTDLSKDLAASIKAQCNLPVINNKVIAYKLVRPDFTSFYDVNFKYKVGEVVEVNDYESSNESCAAGLHFSNLTYWETEIDEDFICLEAEIDLDDVITVQEGKIRCKKARILRAFTMS